MRVAVIGPAHFGIAEPFAGGLEAHTSRLSLGLERSGLDVTVFVGDAEAPRPEGLRIEPILDAPIDFSTSERCDCDDVECREVPVAGRLSSEAGPRGLTLAMTDHGVHALTYRPPGPVSCCLAGRSGSDLIGA